MTQALDCSCSPGSASGGGTLSGADLPLDWAAGFSVSAQGTYGRLTPGFEKKPWEQGVGTEGENRKK